MIKLKFPLLLISSLFVYGNLHAIEMDEPIDEVVSYGSMSDYGWYQGGYWAAGSSFFYLDLEHNSLIGEVNNQPSLEDIKKEEVIEEIIVTASRIKHNPSGWTWIDYHKYITSDKYGRSYMDEGVYCSKFELDQTMDGLNFAWNQGSPEAQRIKNLGDDILSVRDELINVIDDYMISGGSSEWYINHLADNLFSEGFNGANVLATVAYYAETETAETCEKHESEEHTEKHYCVKKPTGFCGQECEAVFLDILASNSVFEADLDYLQELMKELADDAAPDWLLDEKICRMYPL